MSKIAPVANELSCEASQATMAATSATSTKRLRGILASMKAISRARYGESIPLYERALELAPDYVEAQAGLANTLIQRVGSGMSASPAADIARAEGLVRRPRQHRRAVRSCILPRRRFCAWDGIDARRPFVNTRRPSR